MQHLSDIESVDVLLRRASHMPIVKILSRVFRDESGATAIEYGLIAALISVAALAAIQMTGTNLSSTFNTVATNL